MGLKPDERVYAVTLCESLHEVVLMLPDPLHEIRCHTKVQRAIALARKNVDAGQLHLSFLSAQYDFRVCITLTQMQNGRLTVGLGRKSIV